MLNKEYKTPEKAVYSFPDMSVRNPSPKYCEQPLIYLLAYLMFYAAGLEHIIYEGKNPWEKLGTKFLQWLRNEANMDSLIEKLRDISKYLKKTGDGYHIIQDPMKF